MVIFNPLSHLSLSLFADQFGGGYQVGDLDTNYYLFKYLILLFQLLNHVFSVLVDGQLWWWWWLHARWWKFCFAHGRVPREEGLLCNNYCYIIVM